MEIPALPAEHAGTCYPDDPAEAHSFFARALDRAPSVSPLTFTQPEILIVPHIDFRVNFDLYAAVYRRLADAATWPENILILGVGHRCPYEFSVVPFPQETPWGEIDGDGDLYDFLAEGCPFDIAYAPESFVGEHSLEFVAVWLEAIRRRTFPSARSRALTMLCGGLAEHIAGGEPPGRSDPVTLLGERLAEWLEVVQGSPTLVIVSIDGCHVGPRFGHRFPVTSPALKAIEGWERELWARCRHDRYEEFFSHLSALGNFFYFDGSGALSLLIRHQDLYATLSGSESWLEPRDYSVVTFSGGALAWAGNGKEQPPGR